MWLKLISSPTNHIPTLMNLKITQFQSHIQFYHWWPLSPLSWIPAPQIFPFVASLKARWSPTRGGKPVHCKSPFLHPLAPSTFVASSEVRWSLTRDGNFLVQVSPHFSIHWRLLVKVSPSVANLKVMWLPIMHVQDFCIILATGTYRLSEIQIWKSILPTTYLQCTLYGTRRPITQKWWTGCIHS